MRLFEELNEYASSATQDLASGRHRTPDHATSKQGAHDVSFRAGSQKEKLLQAFFNAYIPHEGSSTSDGLTDEQAAVNAGLSLRSCFWKRCSELRDAGLVEFNGETVIGTQGSPCGVSVITQAGLNLAREFDW